MADDHATTVGIESRKNADRHWARMLFFGAVLLVSHLLRITPSDIDVGGVKIAVEDVAVIHGGLAVVFLFYFFSTITLYLQGYLLSPFDITRRMARSFLRNAKRPFRDEKVKRWRIRTPKEAKRVAWWNALFYNLLVGPYGLVLLTLIISALGFAAYDTYQFGTYAFNKAVADSALEP